MRYAIALTATMQQSKGLAIRSIVGVYSASSEAEALGLCIQRARELFPDYSISSTATMKIEDAPQKAVEGGEKQTGNTGSPKLPTLEECVNHLQGHFGKELDAAQYSIVDHFHDYICRQLRASA